MGDLSQIQSAEFVAVVGSDSSGNETNPVNSTANGEIKSAEMLRSGGNQASKSMIANTAIRASVGASNLTGRKFLAVFAETNKIYWGFTSAVTIATGFPIEKNAPASVFAAGDDCNIWLVSGSTATVRIGESP
jgi:hypothetical protein